MNQSDSGKPGEPRDPQELPSGPQDQQEGRAPEQRAGSETGRAANAPGADELERLNRKISPGPLHTSGFNSRLQRRIEQEIERRSRKRRYWRPMLIVGSATAVLAAVLIIPWDALYAYRSVAGALNAKTAAVASADDTPAPPSMTSALLLGLRTEHDKAGAAQQPSVRYSTYRTMLIAPVRGQLQKTAEGSGILMPYKQDFWKIEAMTGTTATDQYQVLTAHLADQPTPVPSFRDEDPSEQLQHVETLVFAGNQYVSVAESQAAVSASGARSSTDRVSVRTLPQLVQAAAADALSAGSAKSRILLTDVFGASIGSLLDEFNGKRLAPEVNPQITAASWTVGRDPGRWSAKLAEPILQRSSQSESYILRDFPRELPDQVVAYDDLCCSWKDIKATWPDATDALSSPMNDIIAIFENGKLNVYPYGQAPGGAPLLSIPLKPGEQLVMAQWATDHYVQNWIDRTAMYLRPAQ
ncbi:hypothetical protein B5M42_007495 [Paenibacillus athensensis]|uniref:Uncharacterized protein n=1 Tax=Paenibacillus athensensis TaxID=1967502 RepID=A0A4Y8Q2E5_9BACL|nr:hypothetical protein [Paenibacillus athensensis]MCD1258676.1 hypothetical protein [Paenibacillus athensensis]